MMKRGLFITFEGADGVGKSTQIDLLHRYLKRKGFRVFLTREPGGTPIGERLRKILTTDCKAMTPKTELLIFEASRAEHVETEIKPRLKRRQIILCDRFADSSTVYQGYVRGLPLTEVKAANRLATGGLRPDITILLDSPTNSFHKRLEKRGSKDRFERETRRFHQKVKKAFRILARKNKRYRVYNADKEPRSIHQDIVKDLERNLRA